MNTVAEGSTIIRLKLSYGFPCSSVGKESTCNAGDSGSIPGSGKSSGEGIGYTLQYSWPSPVAQLVKNPPAMWETWVPSLGWKIPWRRERMPTPVFWPGEFNGLYNRVTKSWTWLSNFHFLFKPSYEGLLVSHTFCKLIQHVLFWGGVSQKKVHNFLLTFFLGSQMAGSRASSWRREALPTPSPTWAHTGPSLSLPGGPPSTHGRRREDQKSSGDVIAAAACFAFVLPFRIILAIISPPRLVTYLVFHKLRSLSSS